MHVTDLRNSAGFPRLLGVRCLLPTLKAACITYKDADHALLKYNTLKSRKHVDMSKAKRFYCDVYVLTAENLNWLMFKCFARFSHS